MPAKEKILIVEDNPANLTLLRELLATAGYEVKTAVDSEAALAVLRIFHPRLILMDIKLPGMDGLELTRRIKADPKTKDIAVVAITAYVVEGNGQAILDAGCEGYIAEPIDIGLWPGIVARYLAVAKCHAA